MEQTSHLIPGYQEPPGGEGAISSQRVKIFIGLAVFIGAMGYFSFMAFQSAMVYYLTIAELHQRGPVENGRVVRVSGNLVPNSFVREPGSTLASFTLTDGTQTLRAVHKGVLPDLFFNEHSEIILEGSRDVQGVFQSQNVLVKCPSKYIAME